MRVRLLDELWITKAPDGTLELGVPTAVRREGGSAPGVVTPAPRIVPPGSVIDIHGDAIKPFTHVALFYPDCKGCQQLADIELRKFKPGMALPYIEHNHGR